LQLKEANCVINHVLYSFYACHLSYEEKGNDSFPCTVYEYSHHIYCNMKHQFVICLHVVLDSPFLSV